MKFKPNVLVLLVALALVLTASIQAQTLNPPYLSEFPSVERVKAEIKGADALDTAARHMSAFYQLMWVIKILAGTRYDRFSSDGGPKVTPDEKRVYATYGAEWTRLYNSPLPPKEKERLMNLQSSYTTEHDITDELLRRFFSPDFRASYYRASGEPPPTLATSQPSPGVSQPTTKPTTAGPTTPRSTPTNASAEAYVDQGVKYFRTKDYEMAVQSYKKAIALDRSQAGAYSGLALAYYYQGQYQLEISAWEQYLSLSPNDVDMRRAAFLSLGIAHYELKQYGEALQAFRRVLSLKPEVKILAETQFWIGRTYEEMEQYEKAVPAFREALRLNPEDDKATNHLGETYYLMGHYPNAVAALQEAIRLKPNDADYRSNLGLVYVAMRKKQQALQVYRKLLTLDKKKAQELLAEINKSN